MSFTTCLLWISKKNDCEYHKSFKKFLCIPTYEAYSLHEFERSKFAFLGIVVILTSSQTFSTHSSAVRHVSSASCCYSSTCNFLMPSSISWLLVRKCRNSYIQQPRSACSCSLFKLPGDFVKLGQLCLHDLFFRTVVPFPCARRLP